ncbi:putative membrane protein [Clostridium collagenovorans DSM 3089]|uniref:Putative membrane protein n=1 Tax=Clostridium collagenovorans DSM 3089 TaxID=1121306 RepID=A0A1M5UW19_9CLOT|nr:hypothetical protein [Clostridium collagenovorans]SHH67068.1 putative membrane protein [Clostridium collagenovorans DSM 3089]
MLKSHKKYICLFSTITMLSLSCTPAFAATKNESVYVEMDSSGSVNKITVSNHLETNGDKTVKDKSDLENITNLKGDVTPKKDGDILTWDANGEDVFYQGSSKKELPVETKITYYLNDKEIKPEELGGKSGNLKISIAQKNNQCTEKEINGENKTIYAPYYTLSILPFNADCISNVKVSEAGHLISDGKRQVVVGVLLPGMDKNLEGYDDIKTYDTIEIQGTIKDFEMPSIYLGTSTELPDLSTAEGLDKLNGMNSDVDALVDASKKLLDGANTLSEGEKTYSSKMKEFENGLSTFMNGIDSALKGLDSAAGGVNTLHDGSKSLSSNAEVFVQKGQSLINGADTQLGAISALKGGISSITSTLPDSLPQKQALLGVIAKMGELEKGATAYTSGVKEYVAAAGKLKDGINQVTAGVEKLQTGLGGLNGGKTQLVDGKKKLLDASSALTSASGELSKGADTLAKGMSQFHNDGILKMESSLKDTMDKINSLTDLGKEITDYGKSLNNFSGNYEENTSKVNFIAKTKPITNDNKKENDKKESKKVTVKDSSDENSSVFDKVISFIKEKLS